MDILWVTRRFIYTYANDDKATVDGVSILNHTWDDSKSPVPYALTQPYPFVSIWLISS